MTVNRIGYPDEVKCPECGRMIEGSEDSEGIVYRCENLSCMAIFDGAELFPPAVQALAPMPSGLVTKPTVYDQAHPDPLSPARVEAMAREYCRLRGLNADEGMPGRERWRTIKPVMNEHIELQLAYERTKP